MADFVVCDAHGYEFDQDEVISEGGALISLDRVAQISVGPLTKRESTGVQLIRYGVFVAHFGSGSPVRISRALDNPRTAWEAARELVQASRIDTPVVRFEYGDESRMLEFQVSVVEVARGDSFRWARDMDASDGRRSVTSWASRSW